MYLCMYIGEDLERSRVVGRHNGRSGRLGHNGLN